MWEAAATACDLATLALAQGDDALAAELVAVAALLLALGDERAAVALTRVALRPGPVPPLLS